MNWAALYNPIYPFADAILFVAAMLAAFFPCHRVLLRGAVIVYCVWLTTDIAFYSRFFYTNGEAAFFWSATAICFAYFGFCTITCFTRLPRRRTAAIVHSLGALIYGWVYITSIRWPADDMPREMLKMVPLVLLWVRLYELRSPKNPT